MGVVEEAVVLSTGDQLIEQAYVESAPRLRERGWLMRRLLLAADVVGLVTAYVLAINLAPAEVGPDNVQPVSEVLLFVATLPLWVLLARVYGLYDRDEEKSDHSTVDDVVGIFQVVTLGTWSFLVATHLLHLPHPGVERLVVFWLTAVVLVPLLRAASRTVGRRQEAYVQNVIIVGSGQVAQLLEEKISKHPEYGLRIVGFVDRDARTPNGNGKAPTLGTTDDLPGLVRAHAAHRVVIAFSTDSHEQTLEVIRSVQDTGWGDTGWVYGSKRDCGNQAIATAAEYSAQACVTAGGNPSSFVGGGQRGSCNTQWQQDDTGALVYRCYGESSVWCR